MANRVRAYQPPPKTRQRVSGGPQRGLPVPTHTRVCVERGPGWAIYRWVASASTDVHGTADLQSRTVSG